MIFYSRKCLSEIIVKELSLVDAPANLSPFYVTKRKTTRDMAKIQKNLTKITRLLAKNMGGSHD